jgi:DNA-binding MarR family transcriptional regulator
MPHPLAADIRSLIFQLRRRLREQAPQHGLTPSEHAVIVRLDRHGPATLTALAQAEGMRSQSLGATVAALKGAGLVAGTPDPNDGRQTLLSLTPTCQDLLTARRAAREDWLTQAIAVRYTPDEQQALASGIDLLKRLLD